MGIFTDRINNFLRQLQLGAEVYYVGRLCDAWHMAMEGGTLVCDGEAWIVMPDGSKPARMTAGDIAFFAHDAAHTLSAVPDIPEQACDYRHPHPMDKHAPGTGLLCGHLRLPAHIRRLLLASFPDFMLIRPDKSPTGRQIGGLIEMMTEEAIQNELGATAVLDRLSDALFLYVIRHALHHEPMQRARRSAAGSQKPFRPNTSTTHTARACSIASAALPSIILHAPKPASSRATVRQ
ncbi:MAG: cupin domain-containing protein [Gallionella sp.]